MVSDRVSTSTIRQSGTCSPAIDGVVISRFGAELGRIGIELNDGDAQRTVSAWAMSTAGRNRHALPKHEIHDAARPRVKCSIPCWRCFRLTSFIASVWREHRRVAGGIRLRPLPEKRRPGAYPECPKTLPFHCLRWGLLPHGSRPSKWSL